MKKEFAVIGLGRFGGSLCSALVEQGASVLAIDIDEEKVQQYADIVAHAVVADTTDEEVLKELGIRNFDHVIVAIGENIQSSILTTLHLNEQGVKNITVKAQNNLHEKVIQKIGAKYIVHPERDMAFRLANKLMSTNMLDYLELSDEHSIVELIASEKMAGKNLIELNIRARFGCNIVAIKRGENILVSPRAEEIVKHDDILIVIGAYDDIVKLEKYFEK